MPPMHHKTFNTITTKGSLFPVDFLERLSLGDRSVEGLTTEGYHLHDGEKLNEAISRSWKNALTYWKSFEAARAKQNESDRGTTETREKWILPLFRELGYGRLLPAAPFHFDDREYRISYCWNHSPVHVISYRASLDERSGFTGARKASPHSMVQDFLNRSDGHLWAFLTNGLTLRILRDNVSLTKQAFTEFDLETMMQCEQYPDFVILWLLCHHSGVEAEKPAACRLEKWAQSSRKAGVRALDAMREGVENAITALGFGFIEHNRNSALKEKLRSGELDVQDYYRQLLRLVYRFLFLFSAEDRELLHPNDSTPAAKTVYAQYYSTYRLRQMAQQRRGQRHTDIWEMVKFVFEKLGSGEGCRELGLPAWGGFLWRNEATADLDGCILANHSLVTAIRSLAFTMEESSLRPVDYKNLGAEELGSVYEALLELHPRVVLEPAAFTLGSAAGNERKTTGSYYTPESLVQQLLDTALEPVIEQAIKGGKTAPEQEAAILQLKICDPAMGSGHFLIGAAHRMAKKLAAVRSGEDEPAPAAVQHALRDVISKCIYGVDINPMAVELCKFILWLEALEPGMPLSFIDHHIKHGNSLIGTTPALLQAGIPDEVFKPLEGDDKAYCAEWKKVNKKEREMPSEDLFRYKDEPWQKLGNLGISLAQIISLPDDSLQNVQQKESRYAELIQSQGYEFGKLYADAWCAAFMWKKNNSFDYPITNEVLLKIEKNPYSVPKWLKHEIERLSKQYQFFHWHIEFPEVFQAVGSSKEYPRGIKGGFDAMLGNPPWERVKLQEKEWFAERRPDIAQARNASERKKLIEGLKQNDPAVFTAFKDDLRKAEAESQFLRDSSIFPLCGRGDINTYAVFAELFRNAINDKGRVGIIVPTGIATDDTTKDFFASLVENESLVSLYDFENKESLFAGVHRSFKLCLLVLTGGGFRCKNADLVFFLTNTGQLSETDRHFTLSKDEFLLLNPNTKTCPIFRSKRDAEITKAIYGRTEVLVNDEKKTNPWGIKYSTMFHMANDSHLFHTSNEGRTDLLPLYEAKLFHQYNHRFATYENGDTRDVSETELRNPDFTVTPRYWVEETNITLKVDSIKLSQTDGTKKWNSEWFIAFRDITNTTNERTAIFFIVPKTAVNHKAPLMLLNLELDLSMLFIAMVNSFVFDYCVRQKMGGISLTLGYVKQLPVIDTANIVLLQNREFIKGRTIELIFTSHDLNAYAKDCGYEGPPFIWDEERRFIMRCELDALYFHLYDITRGDVEYIMETFPIVKRRDEEKHGGYRTKRLILEIYDAMAACKANGTEYQTLLDPPPGDIRVAHRE